MNRRSPFRRVVASAVVVVVVFGLGACGDDDDAAAGDEETTTTTRPTTTESDVEPPGTEPAEVQPYIEDLLRRYDDVVGRIIADPSIAQDADHALYGELSQLIAPDSEMVDAIIQTLVTQGERGVSQRPYDESHLPVERTVGGEVQTVSADEVSFVTCTALNYRLFDSQGRQTRYSRDRVEPGLATAVRVDGRWVLSRLDSGDDFTGCEGAQ